MQNNSNSFIFCLYLDQYFILLFSIFVTLLISGIFTYMFRQKVEQTMKQEMYSSLKHYGMLEEVTQVWDTTQSRLRCCGVESFRDWHGRLPIACCQEVDGNYRKPCQEQPSLSNVYLSGCYEVGSNFIRDQATVIGSAGIIVAVLMLFGMIFSSMFFNMIKQQSNEL